MFGTNDASRAEKIIGILSDCNHEKVAKTVNRLKDKNPGLSRQQLAQKFINGSALKNGIKGGLAGASAGFALPAAIAILGADLVRSLKAQSFLLNCIAYIYDQDPRNEIASIHNMVLASSNSFDEVLEELDGIFNEELIRDLLVGSLIRAANQFSVHKINQAFGQKISQIAAKVAVDVLGRKVADFTMKGLKKHIVKIFWNLGGKRIAQRAAQKAVGRAIPVIGAVAGFGMDWHSLQKKGKLAIEYYEAGIPIIINSLATTKPPKLELISEGVDTNKSVICIRGVLTGHQRENQDWIREIRMSGWRGNIYRFWWDSGDIGIAENSLLAKPAKWVLSTLKWRKHRQNAKLIGSYYLPELVTDSDLFNADSVIFIAHSLGTDLLQYALQVWPSNCTDEGRYVPRIERCLLMGGVSDSGYKRWSELIEKFAHPRFHNKRPFLLNFYNSNDHHLQHSLSVGDFFQNQRPVGLYPIELFSQNLQNIECNPWIGSKHKGTAYLSVVERLKVLQEPRKPRPRKVKPQEPEKQQRSSPPTTGRSSSKEHRLLKRLRLTFTALWKKIRTFVVWLFTPTGKI
jgi:hypothetical protein